LTLFLILLRFEKKGFLVLIIRNTEKNNSLNKIGGSVKMRAPKSSTWFISVILAILGILLYLGIIKIPLLVPYNFWIVAVAFILLAFGSIIKGL